MIRFAILASTNGTDMPAILEAAKRADFGAVPALFITNKPECGAKEKALQYGIPVMELKKTAEESREMYDERLGNILESHEIDLVVLVGWMRLLSKEFVERFQHRILNVHPALLPKYPGMHSIADALEAGEKETGATIHFVDEGEDTGPIILQKAVLIAENETEATLKSKVQAAEQEIYPQAISLFAKGKLKIENGNVTILQ